MLFACLTQVKTPMVHGLAADNNNKGYRKHENMILKIIIWNNHYYLKFKVGLSDDSKK